MKRALLPALVAVALCVLMLTLGSNPALSRERPHRGTRRTEVKASHRVPKGHRHKTVKRCLESDGKTWRKGACS